MGSTQNILQAITILTRIQESQRQDLLLHREELESAIKKLQDLLQTPTVSSETAPTAPTAPALPNSTNASRAASPNRPLIPELTQLVYQDAVRGNDLPAPGAADSQHEGTLPAASASSDSKEAPRVFQEVLKRLNKDEYEISTYADKPVESVVSEETNWEFEDPRIVEFLLPNKKKDPGLKFRAGLSVISLADEYTEWERVYYRTTRVKTLCEDLSTAANSKIARYREYVDIFGDHFNDKGNARKCIEYGVKLRVFERLYSARSEVRTLPGLRESAGVLGILCFVVNSFRRLRYEELPMLVDEMLSSKWRGYAEARNSWMDACLDKFKARIQEISRERKRVLEGSRSIELEERPKRRRRVSQDNADELSDRWQHMSSSPGPFFDGFGCPIIPEYFPQVLQDAPFPWSSDTAFLEGLGISFNGAGLLPAETAMRSILPKLVRVAPLTLNTLR